MATRSYNDIAVAGYFRQSADFGEGVRVGEGDADTFIAKYAADGSFIWLRDFGAAGFDTAEGIRVDVLGNIFTVGR